LIEIEPYLIKIDDGSSLRSVLEQSLYFASRLGQVNCDFSSLLLPLFENVMVKKVENELKKVFENFKVIVTTEKIVFDVNDEFCKEQVFYFFIDFDFLFYVY
jgi:hypothetical protein